VANLLEVKDKDGLNRGQKMEKVVKKFPAGSSFYHWQRGT